jgi:hypothetical protein
LTKSTGTKGRGFRHIALELTTQARTTLHESAIVVETAEGWTLEVPGALPYPLPADRASAVAAIETLVFVKGAGEGPE